MHYLACRTASYFEILKLHKIPRTSINDSHRHNVHSHWGSSPQIRVKKFSQQTKCDADHLFSDILTRHIILTWLRTDMHWSSNAPVKSAWQPQYKLIRQIWRLLCFMRILDRVLFETSISRCTTGRPWLNRGYAKWRLFSFNLGIAVIEKGRTAELYGVYYFQGNIAFVYDSFHECPDGWWDCRAR